MDVGCCLCHSWKHDLSMGHTHVRKPRVSAEVCIVVFIFQKEALGTVVDGGFPHLPGAAAVKALVDFDFLGLEAGSEVYQFLAW